MKNVFIISLILIGGTIGNAAIISLGNPEYLGEGVVLVNIITDVKLLSLDAIVNVSGSGTIISAMSRVDGTAYGWERDFLLDPVGIGTQTVELEGAAFTGTYRTDIVADDKIISQYEKLGYDFTDYRNTPYWDNENSCGIKVSLRAQDNQLNKTEWGEPIPVAPPDEWPVDIFYNGWPLPIQP